MATSGDRNLAIDSLEDRWIARTWRRSWIPR